MMTLASQLETVAGKKKYGYLPKDTKSTVDEIVNQMERFPAVDDCYQSWWELQCQTVVDQDTTNISSLPYECWKLWIVADDDTAPMAECDAAAAQLIKKAQDGDLHAQYLTGKLY